MGIPLPKPKTRPKKGAPKIKRLGRHKAKIERYYAKVYPRHKLLRILKNNGIKAAKAWADKHLANGPLIELADSRGIKL